MHYHKLKAGEIPGTYVVTEPVTESDLLRMTNTVARKRQTKGVSIAYTADTAERIQTLQQDSNHEDITMKYLDNQHSPL
ncbi:hypothetical protein J2R62_18955, partial [Plesiomonas shigelloides]